MAKKENNLKLTIKVSKEFRDEVKRILKRDCKTVSAVVRNLLEQYITKDKEK